MRYPSFLFDIIVVADNCSDRTADIARSFSVQVIERHCPSRQGKPWALAWAFDQLDLEPFDAVMVIDADSVAHPELLSTLARGCPRSSLREMGIQPFNGVSNPDEGPTARMGAVLATSRFSLAFKMKARAGINTPLSNGMCLGTEVLRRYGRWKAFSLSEDWEIYCQLTVAGETLVGNDHAIVLSQAAATLRQARSQRERWAQGRVQVLLSEFRSIVGSRNIRWQQKLDTLAELVTPGPVTQAALLFALAASVGVVRPPGWQWILALAMLGPSRTGLYAGLAIWKRQEVREDLKAFAFLPVYAVWRLVIGITTLIRVHGDRRWTRTPRR